MRLFPALLMCASLVLAQGPPRRGLGPNMPGAGPVVPGAGNPEAAPRVDELKTALSLTDQQVTLLIQNQRERQRALQPIREQLAERQRTLLRSSQTENDPAVLGRIIIDMRNLRAQAPEIAERYGAQARAILTPDQLPKLKMLEDAMKLRPALNEALLFGLLEQQDRVADFVIGLPGMGGPGMRGGMMTRRPLAPGIPR